MKEPDEKSNETYRIIYAAYMREIWLAETKRKSQLKLRRLDEITKSLTKLRMLALRRKF